ncbi:hypothetical protein EJB05_51198 [Eragrostis curvula]|uniref:Uncharacterized protein n=1 Tax=Eragrostis curvula TaxID=38414 RepID=A0A5J9SW96_9POAL|nr:hypothetical protein EJB05_51198 [Eragrostis curvula]
MAALADDHLLPKVPPVVIMDRRQLLLQALSKLGRPNPDEEIRSLGHGTYAPSLSRCRHTAFARKFPNRGLQASAL